MRRDRSASTLPKDVNRSLLRGHLFGLLAVTFAVLGGTAMMTVGAVLVQTATTADVSPDRLAGAPILVSSPQHREVVEDFDLPLSERAPVSGGLGERIAAVAGVDDVAADFSFSAVLDGHATTAHNWQVAALSGPSLDGTAPGPGEVVLDDDVARATGTQVGDRVQVTTDGGTHEFRVSGVADVPGSGLHLDAQTATALAGLPEGQVDLFAVSVADGADVTQVADRIESVVGNDQVVSTGVDRGDVESVAVGAARGHFIEMGGSLGGTLLMLVGCVTAGALAVSVAGRRRDLALLRAVGMTPQQVRRMVAAQATWAALVGLVPGVVIGHLLAGRFADWMARHGLVSAALPTSHLPYAALAVGAVTLLVVQVAARCASWGASRTAPHTALAESTVEPGVPSRWRTGFGLLLIVAALSQSVLPLFVAGEAAFLSAVSGTLVGVIGLALAGPALAQVFTRRLAARIDDRATVPSWLAVHNTRSNALRSAGAVTVLALAASLTITQFYALSTLARATGQERSDGITASASVTGAVSHEDVAGLAQEPDIEAVVPMVSTTVLHTSSVAGDPTTESYPALGLGEGADQVVDPDVRDGTLANLAGDTVALDHATAGSWGLEIGDRVELILANGAEVRPTLVATYGRSLGLGTALVSTDLLRATGAGRNLDAVLVAGDAASVRHWVADRPDIRFEAGGPRLDEQAASAERWLNLLVLLPMLVYVLIAAGNSLAAATTRRRGELSALRVIGATPRQIRSMMTREAGVLAAMAIGAAFVLSVLPMSVLGLGVLGQPWPQGAWWVAPSIAAVISLVAVGTMRGATHRLLARPPVG